jgi:hypothetical protein
MSTEKQKILAEFRQIPGVGKIIAQDFWDIGLRSMKDLKDADPEALYLALCKYQNTKVDRCMLYVFRCAVYYASHKNHDPELLKWWTWKD